MREATIVIAILIVFIGGWAIGHQQGWKDRVRFEAVQCADHGRCFH